jgi:group II intron reverse transcriptase/maturase
VLEPICEAKFHDGSNGFRPNRGVENALAQAEKLMQSNKLCIVVDIDIKGFFDNVSHGKLLKQLWTIGIQDKKLISIISAMLKGGIAEIGFPEKGTAQGSIISPLLSNVVLNELDWWIASQWEYMPTRHAYKEATKANGTQSKSKKYRALRNSALKECFIVRYADDFKIFCRKHKDAVVMFEATKQWLKSRLGLDISPEKSKIVNLKHSYSEFLGFRIKVHKKGKDTKCKPPVDKYVVKSHISEKALRKIKANAKERIIEIQKTNGSRAGEFAIRD